MSDNRDCVASREFMLALCEKHEILTYSTCEVNTAAFIEWYGAHKDKNIGIAKLGEFDLDSVISFFRNDLEELYE